LERIPRQFFTNEFKEEAVKRAAPAAAIMSSRGDGKKILTTPILPDILPTRFVELIVFMYARFLT